MSDYVLPTEIWIEEILTRLPLKTLLRCTSVCKSCTNPFNIIGTCNGLVCLSEDAQQYTDIMTLWNPSIRKFVRLPYPNFGYNAHGAYLLLVGFGFNPVTNDYNVVRVAYPKKVETKVVELYELSTGSW
ncbi:hypothetical protein LguiA_022341 [Lonicera macranthoides]